MKVYQRMEGFIKLGEYISSFLIGKIKNSRLDSSIKNSFFQNGWFSNENIRYSLASLSEMLQKKNISEFSKKYFSALPSDSQKKPKTIGVIIPSNIPISGFHDFLCVLMSGNRFYGKLSALDKLLLPSIAEILIDIQPSFKNFIRFSENTLEKIDAVIATGTNNSAKYFEYYFGKYPNIIRKNRNSVAILTGNESEEDLKSLAEDIFLYFGLGCRNVSKIYLPNGFNFNKIFENVFGWNELLNHNKYANNYNYNKTIYLMNKCKILDNGFFIMKEDPGFSSPVSVLFYQHYQTKDKLLDHIIENRNLIQCIVSNKEFSEFAEVSKKKYLPGEINRFVSFGRAQHPQIFDYADGIDTMDFLLNLN